jgi:small subunit ribosomal protein S15
MISFINAFNKISFSQYRNKSLVFSHSIVSQLTSPQPYSNSKQIKEIRDKYKINDNDTGSPEYQIAALSVRIAYMTAHVKKNPKDFSSTRGLIAMVSARKKLLRYLRTQNKDRFLKICLNLKIRIQKDQQ